MKNDVIEKTDLKGLKLLSRGKVRDIYDFGDELLIVASDRISAFDRVLSPPIPHKGRVLTALSTFWFDYLSPLVENHFLTDKVGEMPKEARKHSEILEGRSMLVRKAEVLPAECIVRGYIAGSAWKEYESSGTVCGERMPIGLEKSENLEKPIFTPSTKAVEGHDENISYQTFSELLGEDLALEVRTLSIEIFKVASEHALKNGIIIADTKFEWGVLGGEIVLADEVFTPDSSRFWPEESYKKGVDQPSFDKQFVRDYLETTGWDKDSPPPRLPDDVVEKTSEKYIEAFRKITGCSELS
jgi:phosphoribosylaminoimidazole-succinocarboxamide synthase